MATANAIAARPRLRERGGREQPQIGLLGRPAELAVGRLVGDGAVARRSLVRVGAAREEQGDEVRVLARGRLLQRREAGGPAGIDGHAEVEQDLHGVAAAAGRQAAQDVRLGAAQQPRRVGVLGGEVTRGRPVAGQAGADQRVERLGAAPRAQRREELGEVWPAAAHGEAVGRATAAVEGRLEVRAVLDEQPHHLRRRLGVHGPLQRVLALAPVGGAALEQHPRRAQPSALRRVGQRHRADEPGARVEQQLQAGRVVGAGRAAQRSAVVGVCTGRQQQAGAGHERVGALAAEEGRRRDVGQRLPAAGAERTPHDAGIAGQRGGRRARCRRAPARRRDPGPRCPDRARAAPRPPRAARSSPTPRRCGRARPGPPRGPARRGPARASCGRRARARWPAAHR